MNIQHTILKKAIFTTLFLTTLCSLTIVAQDKLSVGPDSTLTWGDTNKDEIYEPSVVVTNSATYSMTIIWVKVYNDVAAGWVSQFCDPWTCTDNLTGTFNYVAGADTGIANVHFFTNNLPGVGTVQMYFYDENDSANSNELVTYFGKLTPVGISDTKIADEVKIFPNPARTSFFFSRVRGMDLNSLEIYDLLGTKVLTHQISDSKAEYSIDQLSEGLYFVRFLSKNKRLLFTRSLSIVK